MAWVPDVKSEGVTTSLVSSLVTPEDPQVRMVRDLDLNQLQILIDVGKGKIISLGSIE